MDKNDPPKDTPITAKNPEELGKQLAEQYHIQGLLKVTKIYGIIVLIIEIIVIILGTYYFMSMRHPYFTAQVVPEFLQQILGYLAVMMIAIVIMLGPVITILALMTFAVATCASLVVSICQLKKIRALKLPNLNCRPAIYSIIFNTLALIPIIASLVVMLATLIMAHPAFF